MPFLPHSACLYEYSPVDKLVINASDRGVQDTSVFPDLCLQSKTFLIRLLLHTLSLWLNIAPVQYFSKPYLIRFHISEDKSSLLNGRIFGWFGKIQRELVV